MGYCKKNFQPTIPKISQNFTCSDWSRWRHFQVLSLWLLTGKHHGWKIYEINFEIMFKQVIFLSTYPRTGAACRWCTSRPRPCSSCCRGWASFQICWTSEKKTSSINKKKASLNWRETQWKTNKNAHRLNQQKKKISKQKP